MYFIHMEFVSKKKFQKEEMHEIGMFSIAMFSITMFGPCLDRVFLLARHDADVSRGADVPPTALEKSGEDVGKRCQKKKGPKIQGNFTQQPRNTTKISTKYKCSKLARALGHLLLLPL